MKNLGFLVEVQVPWLSWILTGLASIVFLTTIIVLRPTLHLGAWLEMAISLTVALLLYLALIFAIGVVKPEELREIKEKLISKGK